MGLGVGVGWGWYGVGWGLLAVWLVWLGLIGVGVSWGWGMGLILGVEIGVSWLSDWLVRFEEEEELSISIYICNE